MKKKWRLLCVGGGLIALFSLLAARYFFVQIVQHDLWKQKAASQHETLVKEPFRRGSFYGDLSRLPGSPRQAQPLVLDVPKYHLYIDPQSFSKQTVPDVFAALQGFISLEEEQAAEFEKSSRSRCLKRWLDHHQKQEILTWWKPFARHHRLPSNALYFVPDYQRSYPHGPLLGAVLHTIQELKDEQTDQAVPTGGLESYFHDLLKGQVGKRKFLRSPRNQLDADNLIQSPQDGADIYLTINPLIQAIAEEELAQGVRNAEAKGGWVVIMEAHTGHVVALAQYPSFHPASYRDYFNQPELKEATKIHAITDAFEIGSIMKPITLAIGLTANRELASQGHPPLFDPDAKMKVTRTVFPGRASKPLRDLQSHQALNMDMAVQKSSNIYVAQLADSVVQELGSDWYREQLMHRFGFEQKVGIQLPAEAIGCVPARHRYHPNGAPEWSLPTPYSLSMGYNLLATGLQMVRAYALFANGGIWVQPTLVKKIVRDGETLWDGFVGPFPQHLHPDDAERILRAMKYTTQMGGSGFRAAVPGYTEAGKTGSAEKLIGGQYAKKVHLSSFIGIVPANPRNESVLIGLVTMDEPAPVLKENGRKAYLGGYCAAPVFSRIMSRSLAVLGVPPDDPYGWPNRTTPAERQQADWKKEATQLQELYHEWNRRS